MKKGLKLTSIASSLYEAADAEGKDWKVCIIETGTSKNGFTYPEETLKKAVPLFEGAKACLYEFDNKILKHLPDFLQETIRAGFPRNIVGWYTNVHYGEYSDKDGTKHSGILGDFHIAENAKWLRDLMKDAWGHGKALLGLSIDAGGLISEAKQDGIIKRIVQDITKVNSVDVVTYPSAGGEFIRLVAGMDEEEAPKKIKVEECMKKYWGKLFEMLLAKKPETVKGMDPKKLTEEQGSTLFTEAMNLDSAATLKIVEESVKEEAAAKLAEEQAAADAAKEAADKKAADEQKAKDEEAKKKAGMTEAEKKASEIQEAAEKTLAEARKIKESVELTHCATLLNSTLSGSKLPVPLQEDIREMFSGKVFVEKDLNTAIAKKKDMLAKLSESGDVQMKHTVEMGLAESDKKRAALDLLVDPQANHLPDNLKKVGPFRGIKEAYVAFTGDAAVSGRIESGRLSEAMQSSDFPNALGTSMTRRMAREYPVYPTTWQQIASVVPIGNFKTQEVIRWGGFGRLPVVAEKGSYTDLQGPKDEKATYAPTKKGGLAYVTREMIMNDDLRFLQRMPGALARSAAETLEYYVWNAILANSTCYDGSALGTVAHANYGTSALDNATLTAAKLRMRKQRGQGSVLETGTATAGSTTTVTDSTKTWTVNAYAGKYVRITYGAGAGQMALIASNTADTLTFAEVATAPAASSLFQISAAESMDPKLGLKPKFLVCGPDLEAVADILLKSERVPGSLNNDINVHKGTLEVISPLWLTDVNNWYLAADPAMIDLVEVGFIDGQQTPTLLLQDQPANGVVFTNDQIVYKVRHEYGTVVPDYRGWDLNVVA